MKYGIVVTLDISILHLLGVTPENAYKDLRKEFEKIDLEYVQSGLFFTKNNSNPVEIIVKIQNLSKKLTWLKSSRVLRLIRVTDDDDLIIAL